MPHFRFFSPQTMPVSLQNVKTHVPRFFSTKWETCKINIMCILECLHTSKPLQNQEPTVSANYKMFPLQNQEPAFAYPCRHLGCPKKWFWRTPAGPDNGVEFFGGIFFGICLMRFPELSWSGQRLTPSHHISSECPFQARNS